MSSILGRQIGGHSYPRLSSTQIQQDQLSKQVHQGFSDFSSLAAMSAGSLAYRLGKIAFLGSVVPAFRLTRLLAPVFGLAVEVSAFRSVSSMLHAEKHASSWFSDLISFSHLKLFGKLSQGQNLIFSHLFQDAGMVLGHQLAGYFALAPKVQETLTEQFIEAEIFNFQMKMGMSLVYSAFPFLRYWEARLDTSIQAREAKFRSSFFPSSILRMANEEEGLAEEEFEEEEFEGGQTPKIKDFGVESGGIELSLSHKGGEANAETEKDVRALQRSARRLDWYRATVLAKAARYPILSPEEQLATWREIKDSVKPNQALMDKLINPCLLMVYSLATSFYGPPMLIFELILGGNQAATEAIQSYNPERGKIFSAYVYDLARYKMLGMLSDYSGIRLTTRTQRMMFWNMGKVEHAFRVREGRSPTRQELAEYFSRRIMTQELKKKLERDPTEEEVEALFLTNPNRVTEEQVGYIQRCRALIATQSYDEPVSSDDSRNVGSFLVAREPSAEETLVGFQMQAKIRKALPDFMSTLDDRDRGIFEARLLITLEGREEKVTTIRELRLKYGVSTARIGQLEERIKRRFVDFFSEELGIEDEGEETGRKPEVPWQAPPKPVEPPLFQLGRLFRRARIRLGFSQADLAQSLGLRKGTLIALEAGKGHPEKALLLRWREKLLEAVYEEEVDRLIDVLFPSGSAPQ